MMDGLNDSHDLIQFSQTDDAQAQQSPDAYDEDGCGKCKHKIKTNERRLRCAVCLYWYHLNCTKISVKLYKSRKDSPDNIQVYCDGCSLGAKSLHHKITAISRDQELMKIEINNLTYKNETMKNEIDSFITSTTYKMNEIDQRYTIEQMKTQIDTLDKRFSTNGAFDSSKINALWDELTNLKAQLSSHNQAIQKVAWKSERNEMYTRRENVRFHGIIENENEDTNEIIVQIANSMGVSLSTADISVSHRLGSFNTDKSRHNMPRPIIARFVRRDTRDKIIRSKRKLPWKKVEELREGEFNIFITDDLTQTRALIRQILKDLPDTVRVNTINGKILYTYKDNGQEKTIAIDSPIDLVRKLGWSLCKLKSLGLCVDDEDLDAAE